jgi:AraC-like DNA-binding protein
MILTKRINNWFIHFKKYFFTYNDGFFEVSYIANSPKSMLDSFEKMPFNKHIPENKSYFTNNLFIEGQLQYFEIEQGLWMFLSKVKYKKNISYKLIYDEFIPIDYYTLSFNNNITNLSSDKILIDNIELENLSWSLFKPKGNDYDYHFKNSIAENFFICFSHEWLKVNVLSKQNVKSKFSAFIKDTSSQFLTVNHVIEENIFLIEKNRKLFNSKIIFNSLLKEDVLTIVSNFINHIENESTENETISLKRKDQLKILKIKHYIQNHLNQKFEGITFLSEKFNISPTKLKNDFKKVTGFSIFQFFQTEQMSYAKKILETKEIKVRVLAHELGYENASKFSIAFKKVFDLSPKDIKTKS